VTHEVIVIGGGIVGLSTAMALAQGEPQLRPLVLEKEPDLAAHQTGHNSGVIHTGVYYRPGSLKARYAVEGGRRLVEFCRLHDLPHALCGKVVVATCQAELPHLAELERRGRANGVMGGVEAVGPERLREIEPHAAGIRALHLPGAGIVDYVAVARRYAALVCERGGEVRTSAAVRSIRRVAGEWVLETEAGSVRGRHLVNCGGLHADRLAMAAGARPGVRIVPFRGEYYKLAPSREHLVTGLIYPVPDPAFPFLGVHLTRHVGGGVEAGPNAVLAFKREGYRKADFGPSDTWSTLSFPGFWRWIGRHWRAGAGELYRSLNKGAFLRALRRLVPELAAEDLEPGGAGVRAQALDPRGTLVDDFRIETALGAIHVLNAPSPAATASIPIGEAIARAARQAFA